MASPRVVPLETSGRPLFVVSDLHLGRRPPFGFPKELERTLADAIAAASGREHLVVLNGDILEDGAGGTPFAALSRYPRLREALGEATVRSKVYYVLGNHDPAPARLEDVLPWEIVPGLLVDRTTLVVHGDAFDEGLETTAAGRAASIHARIERLVGAELDLPLRDHSSFRNRLLVGTSARLGEIARRSHADVGRWIDRNFDYLVSLELERDPRFVLATLAEASLPREVTAVLAGHTHHPGIADVGEVTYYNSGTWSAVLATMIAWSDGRGEVHDLVRGRRHGREAYAGWQTREGWLSWWERKRDELSPTRVIASEVRARLERPAEARSSIRRKSGEYMQVTFEERLQGTLREVDGEERSVTLVLSGVTRADFGRSCAVELEGSIDAPGFASLREASGTLDLGTRAWEYDIAFVADDGRPYRLVGRKDVRLFDLARSLTRMRGEVVDGRGRARASADLRFDAARDLGPLIRSLTMHPDGAPVAGPDRLRADSKQPRPPIADPAALERASAALGRWVAVTGAAGHLGYTLVQKLRERGYSVVGVVRTASDARSERLREAGAEVIEADMLVPASLRAALASRPIEGLFHTAAPFKLWARDEEREIVQPMVQGIVNVLRAAERAGVRRVVLTSAGGAVGHDARGREPLNEDDWNDRPSSPYLRGKVLAERRAWEHANARGLDLVTILPTAILGPHFQNHTPVTRMFDDVVGGRLPLLPEFANSWVDVRDVARMHVAAYESPDARGRYLVSAVYASWRALVERLSRLDGSIRVPPPLPDAMVPILPLADDLQARILGRERTLTRALVDELHRKEPRYSSKRAEEELGFRPLDFDRTLEDTLRWLAVRERPAVVRSEPEAAL